jgi:hypothetical protein
VRFADVGGEADLDLCEACYAVGSLGEVRNGNVVIHDVEVMSVAEFSCLSGHQDVQTEATWRHPLDASVDDASVDASVDPSVNEQRYC